MAATFTIFVRGMDGADAEEARFSASTYERAKPPYLEGIYGYCRCSAIMDFFDYAIVCKVYAECGLRCSRHVEGKKLGLDVYLCTHMFHQLRAPIEISDLDRCV